MPELFWQRIEDICCFQQKIEFYFIKWALITIFSHVAQTRVTISLSELTRWKQFGLHWKQQIFFLLHAKIWHKMTLKPISNKIMRRNDISLLMSFILFSSAMYAAFVFERKDGINKVIFSLFETVKYQVIIRRCFNSINHWKACYKTV